MKIFAVIRSSGDRDHNELWIFDAAYLDHEPMCRLALPYGIPLGFQGIWAADI